MTTPRKLSEWKQNAMQTGLLTDAARFKITDNTLGGSRAEFVSIPVSPELPFRRVYLSGWFAGISYQTEILLQLTFMFRGQEIRSMRFGWKQNTNSLGQYFLPIPPFSVQEIATASVGINPPGIIGGEVPSALTVCDLDAVAGVTRFVRMTPLETLSDCDEIRLSGDYYIQTAGIGTIVLWLGCQSTALAL